MIDIDQRIGNLNREQRNGIDSILGGWDGRQNEFILPIIDGPPGTGKTTVGVLAASKYVLETSGRQVAYLCYTNYAAEKAREDFFDLGFDSRQVVRLSSDPRERKWEKGIVGCDSYLNILTENEKRMLRATPILISTLHGSGRIFRLHTHPKIIVDEFSQVSPSLYFSTLSKVRHTGQYNPSGYVLLGDPNQLPVITSQPLLRPNIGVFIFARKSYQPHELTVQYRMHRDICEAVNALRAALNTYPLVTHESVEHRTLTDLGYEWRRDKCPADFQEILSPEHTYVIVNTDNLPGGEEVGFGNSTYYAAEAKLAAQLSTSLSESYFSKKEGRLVPTILSPYAAQIGNIQSYLPNEQLQDQCVTVYKAQGREYPSVIISFTRKNPQGWIGFLKEAELRAQTYVGCSRAKAKLIILLSFSTFLGHGHRDFEFLIERSGANSLIVNAEKGWVP
jgi:hypothetical protein